MICVEQCDYFTPGCIVLRSIANGVSVNSVCLFVCSTLRSHHISKTSCPNFAELSICPYFTCDDSAVCYVRPFLWRTLRVYLSYRRIAYQLGVCETDFLTFGSVPPPIKMRNRFCLVFDNRPQFSSELQNFEYFDELVRVP